jgi:outer membrane lipoprotein-sorting protein
MRPTEKIENFLRRNSISSNPKVNKAVLNELIEEMEKTQQAHPSLNIGRIIMKSKISQLAAAAVIIIAAVIGTSYFVRTSGGPAWADVIKPIFTAQNARLEIVVGYDEGNAMVITDTVKGSRINRKVHGVEHAKIVIDLETSQVITFDDNTKTVIYIDLKNLPSISNYLEHLQNLITKLQNSEEFEVQELGKKVIDGKEGIGFLATYEETELTIWADPETAIPFRIEQVEPNLRIVCKNFEFNLDLDDELFSTDVPEGYTIQQSQLDLKGTEEDFIAGLKMLAEISDDKTFPQDISIEYVTKNAVSIGQLIDKTPGSDEEKMEMGMALGRMMMFIRFFHNQGQGQWHYAGDGVKLGDASKAIFWYQPKESETWRVIYGDLSVKEVNEENLP